MKLKLLPIFIALSVLGCQQNSIPKKEYVQYKVDFEQFDLGGNKMYQSQQDGFDDNVLSYFQQATDNLTTSFAATKDNRVKIEKSEFVLDYYPPA